MEVNSLSVLKIKDVLLTTVPSEPDDQTISQLQEKVLENIEKYESSAVILDISTVETLDSFFARTIVETAEMVKLMGGKTIIVGMQPSVAITATQLGLSFGSLLSALDVDSALDMVMLNSGRTKL